RSPAPRRSAQVVCPERKNRRMAQVNVQRQSQDRTERASGQPEACGCNERASWRLLSSPRRGLHPFVSVAQFQTPASAGGSQKERDLFDHLFEARSFGAQG